MASLLFVITLLQQASAPAGSIHGLVLTSERSPLSGARLELAGPQVTQVIRSDNEGRFSFANLARGPYRLSVKKEGYIREEYGQKKPGGMGKAILVEDGKAVTGIEFRMHQAPTIAGEVRNEDGFPIANILVQAMQPSYSVRGEPRIRVFSSALTDDRGIYRLYWIDPDLYYVNASYLPQLPTPVNANANAPRAAYAPTYFPGTSNPANAELVRPDSGRDINFRLQRSRPVKVSGTVYSAVTGEATRARVTMTAPNESGSTARFDLETDAKGVFEMQGINPGTYILSARTLSGVEIGYSTIDVLDIDRPRADVVVGPGVLLYARLFGEVPPGTNMRSVSVSLLPLEQHIPDPPASMALPTGILAIPNVQPGEYSLRVSGLPETAYVKAAQLETKDILEGFLGVRYDTKAPVDVQLAFDGGQIAGTVTASSGEPVDDATVTLVPDASRRHRPDQYRVATTASDGTFSIAGIPPGEYKAFAWEWIEPNAWMNSDFMNNYEGMGRPVTVGANSKNPAPLRAIAPAR